MNIIFSKSAFRNLEKLDKPMQERIIAKIEFYLLQENPLLHAEKMKDARFGAWRLRIGDYRVPFDVENRNVNILKIAHRKDIYK